MNLTRLYLTPTMWRVLLERRQWGWGGMDRTRWVSGSDHSDLRHLCGGCDLQVTVQLLSQQSFGRKKENDATERCAGAKQQPRFLQLLRNVPFVCKVL